MKLILISLVLLLAATAVAKDIHAPLPKQLLTAKTVFIQNDSGIAEIKDKAYTELQRWGRLKIVDSRADADLILLLSMKQFHSGSNLHATADSDGSIDGYTTPRTVGYTYITMVDQKTGEALWSDSHRWVPFRSATKGLVKSLRKRMEEQERH